MQPDALTGRTVGHHCVLEPLGEGGMGFVYKARDTLLERLVALKVLRPERIGEEADRRRFLREARAAAALNHPHIVTVHEVGTDAGLDYIVMEYIAGGTLADLLVAGRLPIGQVLQLAAQMTDAVSAAHDAGIVHRDLKPSNVMLAAPDNVKVGDFGLAKFCDADCGRGDGDAVTRTGVVMGTAAYMPPEQIAGRGADGRSDIWGIGAVLYEMATGRRPFPETNVMLLINDILSGDPEPPGRLNREVSPGLEKVILKALEKDPAVRYQSARELGADLDRLSAGAPPLASPRRRRIAPLAAMSVAAVSLAVAAGGGYLWRARGASSTKGAAVAKPQAAQASVAEPTSIAVLPFVNMSPEADQEYFSDGLSEELLNVLSNVPQLRVISRTSSFQFKGKNEDIRNIGRKLNVANVLEGSVRKSGRRIRITAQLVDAARGSHLWSETYDRDLDDIFAVQDDIAGSVANACKVTLLAMAGKPSAPSGRNTEAYNLFLQGRHLSDRGTRDSLEKAIGYFEQALKLDPGRPAYWAGLAAVHNRQASQGFVPVDEGYGKSRAEVEKALELDPELAEAHDILGYIRMTHDWDWQGADVSYRQALQFGPGSAKVLGGAAALAGALGRFDEAIDLYRRAIRLDPLNVVPLFNLGVDASYAGRLEEGEAALRKVIELNPEQPGAHAALSRIKVLEAKPEAALEEIGREKHPSWRRYGLALAYHALGRKGEADSALGELIRKDGDDAALQIAEAYAYRRDADKAFEWLERAYTQRDAGLAFLKGDPLLRSIESDLRYRPFLQKMRLPV